MRYLALICAAALASCGRSPDFREADEYARKMGYERIVGAQVLHAADEIKKKAGIKEQLFLFSSPQTMNLGVSRDKKGNIRIVLHRSAYGAWPIDAFRGAIAHEFGHVLALHSMSWDTYPEYEQQQKQTEANAWAIRLVGEDAVRQFLINFGWRQQDADREIERAKKMLEEQPR